MAIYFGNDNIKDIYYSSYAIKEVYYGSEKVWERKEDIPEVDAFMTAAALSESYRKPLNRLVSSLISNNLWDKLIAIYPFCGSIYNSLKYNLKDPRDLNSAFRLTPGGVGTPSYLKNAIRGSGNLNTFISDEVVNLDSLSLSILSKTNNASPGRDFSNNTNLANNRLILSLRYTNNFFQADLYNSTSERMSLSTVDSTGFFTISRTAANSLRAYKNGIQIASNTNTRINGFLGDIYIAGIDTGSVTYRTYEFICIGSGLDSDEASILYDIVTEFRDSINASNGGYWVHKNTGVKTYFDLTDPSIWNGIMSSPSWKDNCSEVKIPPGVTGLANFCFFNCIDITSVILPEGVTSLETQCFMGCTSLSSVTLPRSITSLGLNCFRNCSSLTLATVLPAIPPSLGGAAFYNVNPSLNIKVFSSYVDDYKTATNWKTYASKISAI